MRTAPPPYDPWSDVHDRWPYADVVIETMPGGLLGETRWPPLRISLNALSSAAQRRCTLAHEIVHLERGLADSGMWADREERQVHSEACLRLISVPALTEAVAGLGGSYDVAALAGALDVDLETLRLRLTLLDDRERAAVRRGAEAEHWLIA